MLRKFHVIYEQRERVFHRDIQTRENNGEYTSAKRECFCHYFRVFGYPGGTLALIVHMASQMNRDVTGCFGLLIRIEFLTKHIVIRNFIEIHNG